MNMRGQTQVVDTPAAERQRGIAAPQGKVATAEDPQQRRMGSWSSSEVVSAAAAVAADRSMLAEVNPQFQPALMRFPDEMLAAHCL
mmetsp:Transcript_128012/g.190732  ORF Transcript_128012/g.190732 Transcript_128012/m.190732 type:complete len:86 (+) Transcript_128012:910-1167(+)